MLSTTQEKPAVDGLLEALEQYRNELWAMNFDKEAVLIGRAIAVIKKDQR